MLKDLDWRARRVVDLHEMLEHNAKQFLRAVTLLMRQISMINRLPDETPVPLERLKVAAETMQTVGRECAAVGLATALNMAMEAQLVFEGATKMYPSTVLQELEGLSNAMANELKSHTFLRVAPEYAKYYSEIQPFGLVVADKFPVAGKDIEAGSKALACGLGTATVFHMMRVMEVGLRALGKALGIPYAPSWESYLKQIEAKISAKHRTKAVKWKKDEAYFRDILGDLQAVKIAWRNPTMHIVRHYDQDEGEDVFRAVKRFMNRLAERFAES